MLTRRQDAAGLQVAGTAVIFPIAFSIGGAYKRREAALDDYGAIKAHGSAIAIVACHRERRRAAISSWRR